MLKTFPPRDAGHGVTRTVLSDSPELMVVRFEFPSDGRGPLHSHPHVQATYVQSGRFEFTVGDDTFEVAPGDSFVVPSGVTHGCRALEAGTLVDTFTPRRDDFL
jgi:quercetin dioxygenase-like cupin family protein